MSHNSRLRREERTLQLLVLATLLLVLCHDNAEAQEVQISKEAPGFRRATDEELTTLYRENLDLDFATFKASQLVKGARLTTTDLCHAVRANSLPTPPRHTAVIVVKNNEFYGFPMSEPQPALSRKRMQYMLNELHNATEAGATFPNTAFIMNFWDAPRCMPKQQHRFCRVPLFSLIKTWDWDRAESKETDVLLPFFNHFYQDVITYPWEQKDNRALMRAAMQNGMGKNCTRLWLMELASSKRGASLLDVGITNNKKKSLNLTLTAQVPIPDHAKWKFLLSPDGFTASCRFGKLLQINSVVLKESSPWIEYYYRSVKPHQHYVPFNRNNVVEVLQRLRGTSDAQLQELASTAQHFAYMYLSQHAKAMYVQRALQLYNAMFDDMAIWVGTLQPQALQSGVSFTQELNKRCA